MRSTHNVMDTAPFPLEITQDAPAMTPNPHRGSDFNNFLAEQGLMTPCCSAFFACDSVTHEKPASNSERVMVASDALLSVGSKPDHGMDYKTFMSTEGGRKCPQCGRYAKPETLGNLSFYTTGSVVARISMYGHLPGYGCNPSAEGNSADTAGLRHKRS